jgi:hypothetical protein
VWALAINNIFVRCLRCEGEKGFSRGVVKINITSIFGWVSNVSLGFLLSTTEMF